MKKKSLSNLLCCAMLAVYLLGVHDGKIALWQGDDPKPIKVFPYSASMLPEEARKHIFDKFYQADSSHTQEGNGLGLSLVRRILAIEKGSIEVENRSEGGCCFRVTLNG